MKYKYTLLRSENTGLAKDDDEEEVQIRTSDIWKSKKKDEWKENNKLKDTWLLEKKKENPSYQEKGFIEDEPLRFPYKVFYIIGSEFCERFSFYGLRAVLVLYMSNVLLLGEDSATSLFHGWTFLCYFTPIFGAYLGDSLLGRYRTIFYLSFVYLIGNVVLSLASTSPLLPNVVGKIIMSTIGLVLIAVGTGGIKPCVSAFGGDQFELPEQEHLLTKFFSIFYFSINAGALLSTFLTPILREDVSCFGGECFPLAFGVPALLMLLALVLFIVGASKYKIIPPEGNISAEVMKCIMHAGCKKLKLVYNRIASLCRSKANYNVFDAEHNSHWLHLAADRFPQTLIDDTKTLLAVLLLFIPLPIFWALYDQQGSRWTFQAARMSGSFGNWTIKPDQMQVLNPILVLMLIPLFQTVVYPFLSRFNILTNSLHRMVVGGLLASLAFVVSGFLQLSIEDYRSYNVGEGKFFVSVLNAVPCPVNIEVSSSHHVEKLEFVPSFDMFLKLYDEERFKEPRNASVHLSALVKVSLDSKCNSTALSNNTMEIHIDDQTKEIFLAVTSYMGSLEIVRFPQAINESDFNHASILRIIDSTDFLRLSEIVLKKKDKRIEMKSVFYSKGLSSSNIESIPHGSYEVVLPAISGGGNEEVLGTFTTSPSTVIFLYMSPTISKASKSMKVFNMSVPSLHMMWLLPQYILISVAEIMFSITGIEFSFKQAPARMKSVVQAAWLLTNAFGDLIVVFVAKSKFFSRQSMEFFLFAGLMIVDMIVFFCLASRFDRISSTTEDRTEENQERENIHGQESPFKEELEEQESPFEEELEEQEPPFKEELEEQESSFEKAHKEQEYSFKEDLEEQESSFEESHKEQEPPFKEKLEEQESSFEESLKEQESPFKEDLEEQESSFEEAHKEQELPLKEELEEQESSFEEAHKEQVPKFNELKEQESSFEEPHKEQEPKFNEELEEQESSSYEEALEEQESSFEEALEEQESSFNEDNPHQQNLKPPIENEIYSSGSDTNSSTENLRHN